MLAGWSWGWVPYLGCHRVPYPVCLHCTWETVAWPLDSPTLPELYQALLRCVLIELVPMLTLRHRLSLLRGVPHSRRCCAACSSRSHNNVLYKLLLPFRRGSLVLPKLYPGAAAQRAHRPVPPCNLKGV